ncbi:MAG TPA: Gfo/Idh/MocA family oxidoreductase [Alphaproteobacteria bacterium]|nr:Gfo/Idh/MocA family oxidoreductase [Alphaproteobacteria bacterium]
MSRPEAPPLRIGIAGIGVASSQVLPTFADGKPYQLAGGADIRAEARLAFEKAYGRPTYGSVAELCARDDVDAVWISTPNTLHAEHAICAARNGKHVICEKPMAVNLRECDRMIAAARENGVQFLQGHSKIYQAPIKAIREVVNSGRLGKVIQILSFNSNDWLQRPRLAPELDTAKGGGLVYRQGPHMVDIVRFIGGGMLESVRGVSGRADPHFDTEGHFNALLQFEDGAAASLTFNGYGYFDVTELTWDIGESGMIQTAGRRFPRKPRLTGPADVDAKAAVAHQRGTRGKPRQRRQPFFGLTIVGCERGMIRQSPDGIFVYSEDGCEEIHCPKGHGREFELLELRDALAEGRNVFPDGTWGKATLEVCLAIMASSRDGRSRRMRHQVPAP